MSYYHNAHTANSFKYFFMALGVILILALPTIAMYNKEGSDTVTVYSIKEQQHVSGDKDNFYTTYYYYVNTDKGMFRIEPSGIFHSNSFGGLKEGSTYHITTRGFSFPILGFYPFIINAQEV